MSFRTTVVGIGVSVLVCFPARAGILLSVDDGRNWRTVTSPSPSVLNAAEFDNANPGFPTAMIVGDGGTILKSTNSGDSFLEVASGTTSNLQGLAFRGDNFIAVGESGTIVESRNNSLTNFTEVSTPTDSHLADAIMFRQTSPSNALTEIVVGASGTVLRRQDSGFLSISSNVTNDLNAVAHSGLGQIVAVGDRGSMSVSTDFGLTFQSVQTGLAIDLHDIVFEGNDYFIAGEDGMFLTAASSDLSTLSSQIVGSSDLLSISGELSASILFGDRSGSIFRSDDDSLNGLVETLSGSESVVSIDDGGGFGRQIALTQGIAAVPEPSTLASLLSLYIFAGLGRRRRLNVR
ncbi:MAG: PEP-CTERM sorting domain-containing protein [Planctomycetota bacterium]